jgi:carbamoyl-phosphate synthase/aspartate carbamoyltransferase
MNQPCVDLRTTRCYITAQNHGYAVDASSLDGSQWRSLFLNANDLSNEGIIHCSKPFFSVQFHPEACGGPYDTKFLFTDFIQMVKTLTMCMYCIHTLHAKTHYIFPLLLRFNNCKLLLSSI